MEFLLANRKPEHQGKTWMERIKKLVNANNLDQQIGMEIR